MYYNVLIITPTDHGTSQVTDFILFIYFIVL